MWRKEIHVRTLSSATRVRCRSSSSRFSLASRVCTARAVACALDSGGEDLLVVSAVGERRRDVSRLSRDASAAAAAASEAAALRSARIVDSAVAAVAAVRSGTALATGGLRVYA